MPRQDKTGPEGKGPRTGRQMGNCKDAEPQDGGGFSRGQGRNSNSGRGRKFQEQEE